mmetsp:Transcript_14208/g.31565  ORF Transcript_14208/g.31565 Transcript_14208/m.31565 type:complete len:550 (-) Transcript_14208:30-1679(-)|eukprot:CAMPEP_0204268822 /NCGR_PEP_ID=MMETSP0468-20130131/14646_1 /ASSEMBLY_ACC=CAM_ASM_000383 /TAXON_ID=2969 /ORGANISM="Oxyrrhis marina" /LENGTH=549 /DNA_ID=CAMNT_0051244135 /DNA_START=56 /DNA_END=1705 /DNA_ORIENTATION=-
MFLKVLACFGASVAAVGDVRPHALMQESVSVSSAGVIRLASAQAGYWRSAKTEMLALSAQTQAAQDDMDAKITTMITSQQSAGESCHSSLYRFQNAQNQLHFQLNMSYSVETTLVEEIAAEEAIIKDLEHRINTKHAEYEQRLKECAAMKEEACKQYEMYKEELKELQELGSSPVTPIALFQNLVKRATHKGGSSRQLELLGLAQGSTSATLATRRLMASSRALQACTAKSGTIKLAALQLDLDQEPKTPPTQAPTTIAAHESVDAAESDRKFDNVVTFGPEQCELERKALEGQWRKSFLIIEDLVEETGATCLDTTCEDAVAEERATEMPPLNQERSDRIEKVRLAQHELTKEKEKLDDLESAMTKLERTVKETEETCGNEEVGSEYLESVRRLVKSMRKCPGLTGAVFEIPAFKLFANLGAQLLTAMDEDTDALMQAACKRAAAEGDKDSIRAATQPELDQRVVSGLPETNEVDFPLLGVCPACAGDAHGAASSGHKRKCFRPAAPINATGLSGDCLAKNIAVACLVDRSLAEHTAAKEEAAEPTDD